MDNKNNNQQPIWQKPSMPEPQAPIRRSPNVPRPQQPVRQNTPVPRPQQPVRQSPQVPRPQQPVRQSPPVPRPQQPIRQAQPRAQQPIERRQAQPGVQQPIDRRQAQPIAQQPIDRRQAQPGVQQPIDRRQVQNRLPYEYNKPLNGAQSPVQNASQVGTKPVSQPVNPAVDRKSKKQEKQYQKLQKKADGAGKKKGWKIAVSLLLVVAIVSGIIGVAAIVLIGNDGRDYVATSNSAIETGAVADVTFKDNVNIITDTEKVQKNFSEVTIKGEEYTIAYNGNLPDELAALKEGETFCVPSIKGADVNCFEMGFCGEVISMDTNSITFKVPSMENVFSDFSFKLEGDVADTAEFTPAAGVMVLENRPTIKSSVTPLSASMPNITLANHAAYDSEISIGDYTIAPEFSYINPTQQSVLPGYSMFCDSLKLKLSIEKELNGVKSRAISGTIELEDLATKMDIEWHEDENGNQIVENFDVGFMANVKSELTYTDKISAGLDDLPKASEINDIPSKIEKVLQVQDVTDNEKGKLVLGSYVIGYNVKLPGLVNADNKIGYLSAGIVIQFFVSASGELTAQCSLSNSGFYRAEFNSQTGFSGDAKSYDYPSPALYTGEYTQEWLDSKPVTTIEFKGQLKLNAATGVDVGLCILGMVPIKIANNLAEVEAVFSGSGKKQIVDLADADKSFLFDYSQSVMAKSNSTLKIYLGAKLKMPVSMTLASFGFEKVLFDKVWFQYPDPIPFDYSQCGFGDIFIGNSYTSEEMDAIYSAFEQEHGIDSLLSDFKDGVGNAVVDAFKYELNSILTQADIDLYEAMYGSVKYYSGGVIYFLDEDNTVLMTIVTGEDICNEGGLKTGTTTENVEKIYSAPDDSTTIKLDISEEVRGILRELGLDLGGVEDQDLTIYTYVAEDTGDEMTLLYSGNELKAIIVVDL